MRGGHHDRGYGNGECHHVRNSDLFLQKINVRNDGKEGYIMKRRVVLKLDGERNRGTAPF